MPKKVNPAPINVAPFVHPRFLYDLENCGIKRALDVLGEKWTLLILREAIYGIHRFDDFVRALKCGRGILSARLGILAQANILEKRGYIEPGRRKRAEYHLTAKGRDLYPAMLALSQWSDRWNLPERGPAARVIDKKTKRSVSVVMTSRADVRTLSVDDILVRPGPGAIRLSG
jgi:DNA-binding HxlR family transcriptional regulator